MGKVLLGYNNYAPTAASIGSGLWASAPHSLEATREWALAAYAQSAGTTSADTTIQYDLGSAKPSRIGALFASKDIVQAATFTMNCGTTPGGTEEYTGTIPCWPFTPIDGVYDGSAFGIFFVLPTTITARYVTLVVNGSTIIRVGRVFIGPAFSTQHNPTELTDDWQNDFSEVDLTKSGADYVRERRALRSQALVYEGMSDDEGALLGEINRTHKRAREVVYVPDSSPSAAARNQRTGFLGRMQKLNKLQYSSPITRGMAIGLNERGGAP